MDHVWKTRELICFSLSFLECCEIINNSEQPMPNNKSKNDMKDIAIPRINILLLIVGTRGDVQPFIA